MLYGNHHDAWVHGADDPLSGTASLLETARTLALLVKEGWKPKRTIMLAFWDGEEFGLIGSTEWCEKHADELNTKLVAYHQFRQQRARAPSAQVDRTPSKAFMSEIARDIKDPRNGKPLAENMRQRTSRATRAIRRAARAPSRHPRCDPGRRQVPSCQALGSGSDYTPFLQHMGIASLNVGFGGEGGGGVYHSDYDDFNWYSHFGDPTFEYGKALSEVTTTALLRLADAPLLPFEFTRFAERRPLRERDRETAGRARAPVSTT